MTDEPEVPEDDTEIIFEEEEHGSLYVADGDFIIFDHEKLAEDHGVIGVQHFGGTVYLLMEDLKMHRLEIVPYTKKAAKDDKPSRLRSIRPEPDST